MFTDFLIWLVQERVDQIRREEERNHRNNNGGGVIAAQRENRAMTWIEKLLQTPIDDCRKRSRDLILVPYLVVRRGMTDVDQIQSIVMQWADKYGELKRLEPTPREYSNRVRSRIHEVMQSNPNIPPMRLETLKEKNPELYRQLYVPMFLFDRNISQFDMDLTA